jgi:hypothetical protein
MIDRIWLAAILAVIALPPVQASTHDPNSRWSDAFGPNSGCNGFVYDVVEMPNGKLLMSGSFTACGNLDVTDLVVYDPSSDNWETFESGGITTFAGGGVTSLTYFDGDLIVAGGFDTITSSEGTQVQANSIARWTGSTWQPLGDGVGNGVNLTIGAMREYADQLVVGGNFTEVQPGSASSFPANRLAMWDGTSWSTLGSSGGNGFDSSVSALAVYNGELIAAGIFSEANTGGGDAITANRLARWNGSTWQPVGDNGVSEGSPSAMAVFGGELYVGGSFDFAASGSANQIAVSNIAKWDGANWAFVGDEELAGTVGSIFSLVSTANHLYVGGGFNSIELVTGNQRLTAGRIARWDGTSWEQLAGSGGQGLGDRTSTSTVLDMTVSGDDLYVVGGFQLANIGNAIPASRAARWNIINSEWSALAAGVGGQGANMRIRASLNTPIGLVVAGEFNSVGGVQANRVAVWDGAAWNSLGSGGGNGVSGNPRAIAWFDGDLYIGGSFFAANVGGTDEIAAINIARWDGTTWHAVGSDFGRGVDGPVDAFAVVNGSLFVGGEFPEANTSSTTVTANGLARWDGSAWNSVGADQGSGTDGRIHTLATDGSNLYVGGFFSSVNTDGLLTVAASNIARWDGASWSRLGSSGGNGTNGAVTAMLFHDNELIVSGGFSSVNVGSVDVISTNDLAVWIGTDWKAFGGGLDSPASSIVADTDALYFAGAFEQTFGAGGGLVNQIARWNGQNWSSLGDGIIGESVTTLSFGSDGRLYAGGRFDIAGNFVASNISSYDVRGTLSVASSGSGAGTVVSSPAGISCPSDCTDDFIWGSTITLQATANTDSVFLGWQGGGCSGTGDCEVLFEEAATITAEFTRVYSVTPSAAANGSIAPDTSQSVLEGATTSFALTPDIGYRIDGVGGTCGGQLVGSEYTTDAVTTDCTVIAQFVISTYEVDAFVVDGAGSVAPSQQTVDFGSDALVTVTPAAGWFTQSVGGNACSPQTDSSNDWRIPDVRANCSVSVVFGRNSYAVNAQVVSGSGTVSPASQSVLFEGDALITVTPAEGWSTTSVVGDTCSPQPDSGNDWRISNVQQACSINVSLERDTFEINAQVAAGEGTVDPTAQTIAFGDDALITASPAAGWTTESVTGDTCTPVAESNDQWRVQSVDSACTIDVSFSQNTYTVTAEVVTGSGSVTPDSQDILGGEAATWTVLANNNWRIASVLGDTCTPADSGNNEWQADTIVDDCSVSVTFEGIAIVSLNPARLFFPDVEVGDAASSDVITLQNTGPGALEIGALNIQGINTSDFGLFSAADLCSNVTLAEEEFCGFQVRYAPLGSGRRQADLVIPSNAPDSPNTLRMVGDRNVIFADDFSARP